MLENIDVIAITALLPLTACMLVTQVNPYHALIIRGILGAVAALVYAMFGASDVALTEALVGTMLSITLYAIAVRSSMSFRLGILTPATVVETNEPETVHLSKSLLPTLRTLLKPHHLNLEVLRFENPQALQLALEKKDLHAVCIPTGQIEPTVTVEDSTAPYALNVRIPRLYEILAPGLSAEVVTVSFSRALSLMPATPAGAQSPLRNVLEGQS